MLTISMRLLRKTPGNAGECKTALIAIIGTEQSADCDCHGGLSVYGVFTGADLFEVAQIQRR